MNTQTKKLPDLDQQEVASYLEQNPDFFLNRDSLLLSMQLPHPSVGNDAVSLVERQVSLLRQRNLSMRRQLEEMKRTALENQEIFQKCSALCLELINANDADAFFASLEAGFKHEFNSDACSLIIFSDYAQTINHYTSSLPEVQVREFVGNIIDSDVPTLGVLRDAEQDFLFRHASEKVGSAAVLPIVTHRRIGLLAIGNSSPAYFNRDQGTLFLSFIADVLARLLPRYVYLNPENQ
jgi:uncharacterized protein YigA (DUF484 family)